jgi:hypothetical protein
MYAAGHTNTTGDRGDDHTTTYGTGSAVAVVIVGFLLIFVVLYVPYYLDDTYYQPLAARARVVLVRADTPVVQGVLVEEGPAKTGAGVAVVLTPGGQLVDAQRPDLSRLKKEKVWHARAYGR